MSMLLNPYVFGGGAPPPPGGDVRQVLIPGSGAGPSGSFQFTADGREITLPSGATITEDEG